MNNTTKYRSSSSSNEELSDNDTHEYYRDLSSIARSEKVKLNDDTFD